MNVNKNQEKQVTSYFNTLNLGLKANPAFKSKPFPTTGMAGRYDFMHDAEEYEQVRSLYRNVLSEQDKVNLAFNICQSLKLCRQDIQDSMLRLFYKVDEDYGNRVSQGLGAKSGPGILGKMMEKVGLGGDNKAHMAASEEKDREAAIM